MKPNDVIEKNEQVSNLTVDIIREAQGEALQQLYTIEKCIKDNNSDKYLESQKYDEWLEHLIEQRMKVEDLELTIAFVGTMKAGKSMTINAIIGSEVLPSRAKAMTVLPTVITHQLGQTNPILKIEKVEPFNNAINDIKKSLIELDNNHESDFTFGIEEQDKILDKIRSGHLTYLKNQYDGSTGIYDFLESINDIVRIVNDPNFCINNPLNDYTLVSDFPHIYVEFSYLKDRIQNGIGKLSLIDTPGPNEAGQGHLKVVVQEQLHKASAIVSILDFTQLKTTADNELRELIMQQHNIGTNIFVMVNKFDQRNNQRDMNIQETNNFVNTKLFPPQYLEDGTSYFNVEGNVYPISAKKAFYANLALREIEKNKKLPPLDELSWVDDFKKLAYGETVDKIDFENIDIETHKLASEKIWKNSLMAEPLQHIIARSLEQAVPLSLKAAIIVLTHISNELQEGVQIRLKSLDTSIFELTNTIKRLEDRLVRLNKAKEETINLKQKAIDKTKKQIDDSIIKMKNNATNTIENAAKATQQEQEKQKTSKRKPEAKLVQIFSSFFSGSDHKEYNIQQILQDTNKLKFNSENDAKGFVEKVFKELSKELNEAFQLQLTDISKPINYVQNELSKQLEVTVQPILNEMQDDANNVFKININFEKPNFEDIKLDMNEMSRTEYIQNKTHTETRSYTELRWYTLWLYPHEVKYTHTENYYLVDSVSIKNNIVDCINKQTDKVRNISNLYINNVFKENIEIFFCKIEEKFHQLSNNINSGIKLKEEEQYKQDEIKTQLDNINENIEKLSDRTKSFERFINGWL